MLELNNSQVTELAMPIRTVNPVFIFFFPVLCLFNRAELDQLLLMQRIVKRQLIQKTTRTL